MTQNLWPLDEHALAYLGWADAIPHRTEGEAEVLAHLPEPLGRVLDLGCGDGRLMALVRAARRRAGGTAVDFSPAMLSAAVDRFSGDGDVDVIDHDLDVPLPDLGRFEAVVSSFAIHHVDDRRKEALYGEVFDRLLPGGTFLNLEHVASPTPRLHARFMAELDMDGADEDPSNKLAPVEAQLGWLRAIGFEDVDCHWKWREMALLGGVRPAGDAG
ncbi:MAG: tRNA (cmo5U34)-methyltransferase [Actinomycetota bacterium]|nr:tRNA (cmo5U34)-methyltransferase [Actinomycetota bacterium]